MSKLLSELVAQLQLDVPPEDDLPTETQYESAVQEAIEDFSERCGVTQIGTLNIVSGTSTYDLPADFLRMIKLYSLASSDVLYGSDSKLIPISEWQERYTIRNGQITFYPIPRYTIERRFSYKAGWVGTPIEADGSQSSDVEYATLGEREARIVLLKAKALAATKKANSLEAAGLKYSFGAVSEDLSGISSSARQDAKQFEDEYLDACKNYNGQHVSYA